MFVGGHSRHFGRRPTHHFRTTLVNGHRQAAQLVSKVATAVIQSVPDTDNHRIGGSDASQGRWSYIQGGVFDDLAARAAEISAEEHALRPVVFGAEWR
jgi:hypothetical protein